MRPPSPGGDGTDGRWFESDGRCHLPSGHASSPLESQQSRKARGMRGAVGPAGWVSSTPAPASTGVGRSQQAPKSQGAIPLPFGPAEVRSQQPLVPAPEDGQSTPGALPPAPCTFQDLAQFPDAAPKSGHEAGCPAMGSQHPGSPQALSGRGCWCRAGLGVRCASRLKAGVVCSGEQGSSRTRRLDPAVLLLTGI